MQTQSEHSHPGAGGEWVARTETPSRSVFGNYRAADGERDELEITTTALTESTATLQERIDTAVARSFVYRLLAAAYQDPEEAAWAELSTAQFDCFVTASESLGFREQVAELASELRVADYADYRAAHFAVFGHAARGRCPLNEIEYGDVKADPLFQPHRLADLAAFYRAFGLELSPDADERQDHICMELEFMSVLAVKEAYAVEHQLEAEELAVGRDAQKKFLREHLGRWLPAFCRRLAAAAEHPVMRKLAEFTRIFVEGECSRLGVKPGGEDMLLRPIDEAAESMCASCGLGQLPPGASTPSAES